MEKKVVFKAVGSLAFAGYALWHLSRLARKQVEAREPESEDIINKDAEFQANEYEPIQSPSEIAAGHPIVGAS